MATTSSASSSAQMTIPAPFAPKRSLAAPVGGGEDGSVGGELKRMRRDLDQPASHHATFIDPTRAESSASAGEEVFIGGTVMEVTSWKEDTGTAIVTLESESALLIDCVLRGDWAEQIILPQLGTTVNVLTADLTGQDHLHHHPRPDRTESQPQPRCTAVYDRGLTIRWDTVTELENNAMDMRRPLSGSSSLAAVEELTPPGGSYPSRRSSPVRQPRPTTAILTNRLAERSQALSSPSSVVVPAKRSASPSPTVAQAWKKPFTDHSVSQPVATAKSSPKVKRESSAALDMPPTSSRRVSGSSAETGKRADGDCALASRVDGVPAVKVELASSLSLMDAVPADPPRSAMSQSSSAACAGSPQSDVAAHATDASPSVAGSASTGASAESTVSTVSAAKSRKDRRKANEAKHKEGLDGGEAAHSRAPKAGLKAAAAQERMNAEQGKFDLGLVTPAHTYSSVAELRALGQDKKARALIAVVTHINPIKYAKSGQPWILFRVDDPSGDLSVKLFSKTVEGLPPADSFQIGSVLVLRGVKVKMFGDALELLGNSFDGFSWAFVDTDLSTFVCQQPIKPTSLDLASLAALSPLAEAYLHKLAMWSKKQFNLIKDEASGAVNFADESVAVKSKQRPTLRLEEIKDERQFFDCIGQIVKVDETDMKVVDVWITDWTSNPLFQDYGPSTSYDATPTAPFGHHCLKIGLFAYDRDKVSSLRVGKPVKIRNVKPRIRDYWEASIMDPEGSRIERLEKSPELDALADRRGAFLANLRERTKDDPLPEMAKDVVAAPVASAGRPTLTIEQLKPLEYCNLVCQVVDVHYLNTATSTIVEVTDFTDNRLISVSKRPDPPTNPPSSTFGRYVLQITFWDSEARGKIFREIGTGSLIKLQNLLPRIDRNYKCLFGHINPPKTDGAKPQSITILKRTDVALAPLLSRRDAYFSPTHDEDAPRPRVSSEQTPAREPEPVVAPDILAPVREATASPPPADDDVPAPTGTLGAAKIGSRLDCIVQVVSIRSAANPTVLLVTDFTANPSLEMARHAKAPDGSVFPKEAFGRHVWTVWVDPSVGLKPDMVDELVEGKILHLRGLDVVEGMGNKGLRGNMVRGELEGARVSVTRMPDSDARAKKLLRQRHAYYNPPPTSAAVRPPPPSASTIVETGAERRASTSPAPFVKPNAVNPNVATLAVDLPAPTLAAPPPLPHRNAEAGPSRLRAQPLATSVASTSALRQMAAQPYGTSSPTITSYHDLLHPNGSSLSSISSTTDRSLFQTRARIVDYLPRDLTQIVRSTCEACGVPADPCSPSCSQPRCPRRHLPFLLTHTYILCLHLSDSSLPTSEPLVAGVQGEEMLALFPKLPPNPEDFLEAPAEGVKYLKKQLALLVLGGSGGDKENAWCDLGVRKWEVRQMVGRGGVDGNADESDEGEGEGGTKAREETAMVCEIFGTVMSED